MCEETVHRAVSSHISPFILAAKGLIEQGAIGDLHDMEVRVMVYTPWQLWEQFMVGIPFVETLPSEVCQIAGTACAIHHRQHLPRPSTPTSSLGSSCSA